LVSFRHIAYIIFNICCGQLIHICMQGFHALALNGQDYVKYEIGWLGWRPIG
jgi:hypothetical protein